MMRVLLVDDYDILRKSLRKLLKLHDLEVEEAENGEEGLEILLQDDFDLVITDYDMPGLNGLDFIEKARQHLPNLPFILMSASPKDDFIGMKDVVFIRKPFEYPQFVRIVKILLMIYSSRFHHDEWKSQP